MRLNPPCPCEPRPPPGRTELIVFDDTLPGFGVRLRAGGKRVWIAQYRMGQKQRRVTIGSVETLDPDQARKAANSILAKVHLGSDPQAAKTEAKARARLTLGTMIEPYLEFASRRLKPRTFIETSRYLRTSWKPLHGLTIERVTTALQLSELALANGPIAANRARIALSSFFTWAMREGLAEMNPVVGTNHPAEERSRDRVLTDDELAGIWAACRDNDYGRIVRLLILTGQRRANPAAKARTVPVPARPPCSRPGGCSRYVKARSSLAASSAESAASSSTLWPSGMTNGLSRMRWRTRPARCWAVESCSSPAIRCRSSSWRLRRASCFP